MLAFFKKNADITKIKVVLALQGTFSETNMSVYFRTKFHVSSIILTSFKQWGGGGDFTPLPPLQNKTLKSPP